MNRPSASGSKRSPPCWTSAAYDVWRRPRQSQRVAAALALSCAPRLDAQHDWSWAGRIACWAATGCGPRAQDRASGHKLLSVTAARLLNDLRSLIETRCAGIRNLRCFRHARACANSPRAYTAWAIRSTAHWWVNSCTSSITACKPIARRARDRPMPITTRNSIPSMIG